MTEGAAREISLLKAVADETRLGIVRLLSRGELCACRLLENFKITQPTLSHHLSILSDAALVSGRREGKWTYYSLNRDAIESLRRLFGDICDGDAHVDLGDIAGRSACAEADGSAGDAPVGPRQHERRDT